MSKLQDRINDKLAAMAAEGKKVTAILMGDGFHAALVSELGHDATRTQISEILSIPVIRDREFPMNKIQFQHELH